MEVRRKKTLKDHESHWDWQLHELKPIHLILRDYEGKLRAHEYAEGGYDFEDNDWTINDEMMDQFGDGQEHYFVKIDADDENEPEAYTHRGEDGWYYSDKWFADSRPIIELDEGDFLL